LKLLNKKEMPELDIRKNRREFLAMGFVSAGALLIPDKILAAVKEIPAEKKLSLYNPRSHDNLETVFWKDGRYVPGALSKINYMFRDSRTGEVTEINKKLLEFLYSIQQKLKTKEPIHLISGYRSPRSNALLRKRRKGVAKNSFHMYGKAVDVRIPGCSLKSVRRAAMSCEIGGVGYYPRSKFVHLDVGDVRYWWG